MKQLLYVLFFNLLYFVFFVVAVHCKVPPDHGGKDVFRRRRCLIGWDQADKGSQVHGWRMLTLEIQKMAPKLG